ncbi:50S ribosomal protein L18 [Cyanobacteria bacterium FACHB-63]|nr:50S ribosomal protein L18 [Cyanobacteria bacterium FACHB-63]
MSKVSRRESTRLRHARIRRRVSGTPERPRLAVFKSNHHIYVQLIDDVAQTTIAAASTVDPELKEKIESGANCAAAAEVGRLIADRAKAKGIEQVVFDRGGNLYHGRVQTLADAAREAGLNF